MEFFIHKKPTRVWLSGLYFIVPYFVLAVALFRDNKYYYLILGSGVWALAMLLIKSFACIFINTFTVTEHSIQMVTPVGGITRVNFDDLDRERTILTDAGLALVPNDGEPIVLTVLEFSRQDIARLAHHIGLADTGWHQEF